MLNQEEIMKQITLPFADYMEKKYNYPREFLVDANQKYTELLLNALHKKTCLQEQEQQELIDIYLKRGYL